MECIYTFDYFIVFSATEFFYAIIIFCDIDTSDKNYDISMVSQIFIS